MKTAPTLKSTNIMNLQVGNIVHFYGARFEITSTRIANQKMMHEVDDPARDTVMQANGKWIDGEIIRGYFGPSKDWGFQGNANVSHEVEELATESAAV